MEELLLHPLQSTQTIVNHSIHHYAYVIFIPKNEWTFPKKSDLFLPKIVEKRSENRRKTEGKCPKFGIFWAENMLKIAENRPNTEIRNRPNTEDWHPW